MRIHFPVPRGAPQRARIFGLYAKQLPPAALAALGDKADGLSGRDILDVCRTAERRWVGLLLRGEVSEPPLPPERVYEEALAARLSSSGPDDDEDAGAGSAARPGAGLSLSSG